MDVTPACCVGSDVPEIISMEFDVDKAAIVACCTICSELYAYGLYTGIRHVRQVLDLRAAPVALERPNADEEPWRSVGHPLPHPRSDTEQRAFLRQLGAVWDSAGVKEVFEALSPHEEEELLLAIGFHLIVRAQVGVACRASATQTDVPIRTHRSPPAREKINYGGCDAFEGHSLYTGNAEGAQPLKIHVAATHDVEAGRVESELSRATRFAGAACILVTRGLPGATGELRVWMHEPDTSACKVRLPYTPVVAASASLLVAAKRFSLRIAGLVVNQKLFHRVALSAREIAVLLGDDLAAAAALSRDIARRLVFGLGDDASNFLFKFSELLCPLTPLVSLLGIGVEYQAVASHSRRPLTLFPRPPATVKRDERDGASQPVRGVYAAETPLEPAGRAPCPSPLSPAPGCAPFTAYPKPIHLQRPVGLRLVDGTPAVPAKRPRPAPGSREADQRAGGLLSQLHADLDAELYPALANGADAAAMTVTMRSESVDLFERYHPTLWKAVQSYGLSRNPCVQAGNLYGALRVMDGGVGAVDVTQMRVGLKGVPGFVDLALGDPRAPPVQRMETVRREGALGHLGDFPIGQYIFEYGRCLKRGLPCEASYADTNHEWSVISAAALAVGVTVACDTLLEGCPTAADHLELARFLGDNCAQMCSLVNSRNMAFALRRFNAASGRAVVRCFPRWIVPRLEAVEGQCPNPAAALPASAAPPLSGPLESAPAGQRKRPRAVAVTAYLGLASAESGASSVSATLVPTRVEPSMSALPLQRILTRENTAPLSRGATTAGAEGGRSDAPLASGVRRVRAEAHTTAAPASAVPLAAPADAARVGSVPVGRLVNRPELVRLFRLELGSQGTDVDAAAAAPAAVLLKVPTGAQVSVFRSSAALSAAAPRSIEAAVSAPSGAPEVAAGRAPADSEGGGVATSAGRKRHRQGGGTGSGLVVCVAASDDEGPAEDTDEDDPSMYASPSADPLAPVVERVRARKEMRRGTSGPSWGGAAVTEGGLHIAQLM